MSKIDSWVTKVPRLKNSKVARFSYKAEAYANDDIEGVDSYDYSRDMNVPLATHTDFDASVLSIGARTSFSSVPKNGLNHFFGRVSYNLNKVIDFLSDLLDDFRVQGVETVSSSVSMTLPAYYSGKKLRIVNTHATNSILITFYSGQTFKGSATVMIPANTILELELIGTTWLHVSDFTESPPTPWAQYSGKDIPQLPDNIAGTTYKRDNDWTTVDGWGPSHPSITVSVENETLKVAYDGTRPDTGLSFVKAIKATGKFIKGHIKCTVPILSVKYYTGSALVPFTLATPNAYETGFYGYIPIAHIDIILYINAGQLTAKTCWLSQLYIGTGAYDRLVFDNSYHYRHLINNAVVPTPKGLYFNGETSYLRSKEKITLPDVMPFHAIINCAVKTTAQTFFYAEEGDAIIAIYRKLSSGDLVLDYYNTNTSAVVSLVIGTGFYTGLDNTDIDTIVKIDFTAKTVTSYKEGTQVQSISIPYILKPASTYIYYGYKSDAGLHGYMRNIQLYDTALTDTQRNWLAQGNTPPILYDVTNWLALETLRYNASFLLQPYSDGKKLRIANTHASNTITCTLPTGYTMNGQSSFTIAPDTLLEFELIGKAWKCVSNKEELLWENPSPSSNFVEQPITLAGAIEQFRFYMCEYRYYKGYARILSTGLIKVGNSMYLSGADNSLQERLLTSISGKTMTLSDGYYFEAYNTAGVLDNSRCIPVAVYGIK